MTAQYSDILLIGETVNVNYIADPSVGYGRFRLENHGAIAVTAAVKSAWWEIEGHRRPLTSITVFDLNQDKMVDPQSFKVDAEATMTFLVGFPRVALEPSFGESIAVGLQLNVNGAEMQALSPIELVRRFPKGV